MRSAGIILLGLLLLPLHLLGRIHKDTIYTTDNNRIILTYEINYSTDQTTIRFKAAQKEISIRHKKYKDVDKMAVMFFDKVGRYNISVNIEPEAFATPSGVQYQKSDDGFFLMEEEPELSFTVESDTELQIPIYLAYKIKKGKYELFDMSRDLRIPLKTAKNSGSTKPNAQTVQQTTTITSTMELESDNVILCKILDCKKNVEEQISKITKLPFPRTLQSDIDYLQQTKRDANIDKELLSDINIVLDRVDSLEQRLKEAEEQAKQEAAELKMQKEKEAINARNDSIAAAQQAVAEKEKKRNLWMMIGGIVLAILAFIGNQVFQSLRNKKNQMQMMSMQQNIANKAEAEAKRRARNATKTQGDRIIRETKQRASDVVRGKKTLNGNGKSKNISI